MQLSQIVLVANVLVAGTIAVVSLSSATWASRTIYENQYMPHPTMQLVGALWLAIALLSVVALFKPQPFAVVMGLQLIYKAAWLLLVAMPAILRHEPYPKSMALFFVVWVLVLPWAIPWKSWF